MGKKIDKAIVDEYRGYMKEYKVFPDLKSATSHAVDLKRNEKDPDDPELSSVWKQPKEVGDGYIVVPFEMGEDALIAGYTVSVTDQQIYNIVHGRSDSVDDIEEV